MSKFFDCSKFVNPTPQKLVPMEELFNKMYLSFNVPVKKIPNIYNQVHTVLERLGKRDKVFIYPEDSIHFSFMAFATMDTTDISEIEHLINNREETILQILDEERKKLGRFKVALKFVNKSSVSAYFVIAADQEKRDQISTFQQTTFKRISEVLGDLAKGDYLQSKLNPECFPMNFLRWKTENVNEVEEIMNFIEEEYERNVKENLEVVDTVRSAFLTYSNQFWAPEGFGKKIIKEINFSL